MQREGSVFQYVLFWQILLGWPRCTSGSRLDFLQRYAKGTGYAKTYLESLLNVQVSYPVKYWLQNTHHVCVDRLDIESKLSILNLSYRSICLSINYKVFQMVLAISFPSSASEMGSFLGYGHLLVQDLALFIEEGHYTAGSYPGVSLGNDFWGIVTLN